MIRRFLPLAGILSFSMLLLASWLSSDLRDNQSALRRLGRQRPSAELAPQEEEGFMIVYIFVLSKQQDEDCSGCWMTDAVFMEAIQKVGESV